jgi:hypothetical protein
MAASTGLPVNRLINVEVDLTPLPVPAANFNTLLIVGDSNIITPTERIRSYNTLNQVAVDFLATAPEYKAAAIFFAQRPQPRTLYIGRWNQPTESLVNAIIALDSSVTYWYFVVFATTAVIANADYLAVAAYIEGADNRHMMGVTTNAAPALVTPDTTSIGALLKAGGYSRSAVQYSTTSPYAMTSLFARACTVDFNGANTTITLMWKTEPTVNPEYLGSTGADALDNTNYNYCAQFSNGSAIIVNGKVAAGFYIDEVWGADWFGNAIQTALFNELLTENKVPQTDAGVNLLITVATAACAQAVTNGLLAPVCGTAAGSASWRKATR